MWSVTHLCRCAAPLRAQGNLLAAGARSGFSTGLATRQLITTTRNGSGKLGVSHFKVLRLRELVKSNAIIVRLTSSTPKPKSSKIVGYWLLGCSGMVFTAVVLGMVAGYMVLLYSIYYVVNIIVSTTNGSK